MIGNEFRVQASRRGDMWEDSDNFEAFGDDELDAYISDILNCEGYGGKYSYRIVNQDDATIATSYRTEEAPAINTRDPLWLECIYDAYPHLTQQDIAVACRVWLFHHNIPEDEGDI